MILVDIVQGQCISYCDSTTLHGFQYIPKSGLKESPSPPEESPL